MRRSRTGAEAVSTGRVGSAARQEGVAAGDSPARIALNPARRQSHRQSPEQRTSGAKAPYFPSLMARPRSCPSQATRRTIACGAAKVVTLQTGIRVFPRLLGAHKFAELLFQPAGFLILLARGLRLVRTLVREPEIEVGLGQIGVEFEGVLVAVNCLL